MQNKIICAACCLFLAPLPAAYAQSPTLKTASVCTVVDAYGGLTKRSRGGGFSPVTIPLRNAVRLRGGDTVRTGGDCAALFTLPDDGCLRMGANSTVTIGDDGVSLSLQLTEGQAWLLSPKGGMRLSTPSAIVTAPANALVGVGYDSTSDSTIVSVNAGTTGVSLASGGWQGVARAGQFVQYLRIPRRNIRLRSPQVAAQPEAQVAMWKRLSTEPWTRGKPGKLMRGIEADLQVLVLAQPVAKGDKP